MSLIDKLNQKEKSRGQGYDTTYWHPEPLEVLQGKVTDLGVTITQFGEQKFLEVETEQGEKFTVFLTTVLSNQVDEEGVTKGDHIGIKYLGEVKGKKRTYKDYLLVKESPPVATE